MEMPEYKTTLIPNRSCLCTIRMCENHTVLVNYHYFYNKHRH